MKDTFMMSEEYYPVTVAIDAVGRVYFIDCEEPSVPDYALEMMRNTEKDDSRRSDKQFWGNVHEGFFCIFKDSKTKRLDCDLVISISADEKRRMNQSFGITDKRMWYIVRAQELKKREQRCLENVREGWRDYMLKQSRKCKKKYSETVSVINNETQQRFGYRR